MEYNELNDTLARRFPELIPAMEEELDTYDCYKPGPYVLYENVFNSYVAGLLKTMSDPKALERVFDFYEELANSNDATVKNFLQVALLESLWDEPTIFKRAMGHMHLKTKEINDYISEYLRAPGT